MADSAVAVTAGSGTNIDTRTEGTNGNHRQVVVLGDPATNAGVAPVDATNGLSVNITNASLTVASHAVTDGGGSLTVDNGGTFAVQATVAAGATNIAKAEDVASADADVGVPAMAVRKATPANTSGTDGDYEMLQMSAGRLWVDPSGVTLTVASHAVTNAGTFAVQSAGDVAHDASDSGSPVKNGNKATTSLAGLTLVANGDRTDQLAGVDGVQIVRPHCNLEDIVSGVAAITDGSSTSVIASAGAGVKNYITDVIISNTSATAVTVDLRDGAAGSVKATFPVPANTSGVVKSLAVPLPFTAATAVCADPSAAASTITVTLIGFKSKV